MVWRDRRLAAVDRRGNVRWSLLAPRPVTNALWAPSGFRVAYRSGQDLRVVAGDGTGDRLLDPGTFRAMAWRPGAAHVLAYLSGAHIDIVDVDTRRRLARIRLPHVPHELAWSADGSRLYVNLHRSLAIYDARGRRTGRIWMPGRQTDLDLRPRAQRHARGGRARAASGRSSEVALMGPGARGPGAVPRRRAASPACASRPRDAGCWSPGRSPTSGCSCARARPAPGGCSPRRA